MFHPTLAWSSYDDMEDFDAMAHIRAETDPQAQAERRQDELSGKAGPMMPRQRAVGVQPTVGPQPQPQPVPQVLPQTPLRMGAQMGASVSDLAATQQANQTVDEQGNPIQRNPPMQTETAAGLSDRVSGTAAYQQRMAGLNPFNRPLPDEDSQ